MSKKKIIKEEISKSKTRFKIGKEKSDIDTPDSFYNAKFWEEYDKKYHSDSPATYKSDTKYSSGFSYFNSFDYNGSFMQGAFKPYNWTNISVDTKLIAAIKSTLVGHITDGSIAPGKYSILKDSTTKTGDHIAVNINYEKKTRDKNGKVSPIKSVIFTTKNITYDNKDKGEKVLTQAIVKSTFTQRDFAEKVYTPYINTDVNYTRKQDGIFELFENIRIQERYKEKTGKRINWLDSFDFININRVTQEIESLDKTAVVNSKIHKEKLKELELERTLAYLYNLMLCENNESLIVKNKEVYNKDIHSKLSSLKTQIIKSESTSKLFNSVFLPFLKSLNLEKEELDKAMSKILVRNGSTLNNGHALGNIDGSILFENKELDDKELSNLLKSTQTLIDSTERSLFDIPSYGKPIQLESQYSRRTNIFQGNKSVKLSYSKEIDKYIALFLRIFKDITSVAITAKTSKKVSIKTMVRNPYTLKIFKNKHIKEKKKPFISIILDCSGSMDSVHSPTHYCPTSNGRNFIELFNRLSALNICTGVVAFSSAGSGGAAYTLEKLPVEQKIMDVVHGSYGAEGLHYTMKAIENILAISDHVFVFTDGQICDEKIDLQYWKNKNIQPIGLYSGNDYRNSSIVNNLKRYFSYSISCNDFYTLTQFVVNRIKSKI